MNSNELRAEAAPAEAETMRIRSLSGGWKALLVTWTVVTLLLCINQQFNLRFFVGFTFLNTEYYYLIVGLLLPLVFIMFPASEKADLYRVPWYDVVLLIATTAVSLYIMSNVREAAAMGWERFGAPDPLVWACYAMWALLMETLRRTGGTALMLCILPFSFYPIFAASMPRPFTGADAPIDETAAFHMLSSESLLGIALQSFAEVVIGFLVFGAALQFSGAGRFFIQLAFALTGRFRRRSQDLHLRFGHARHDVGQHHRQRADRRHDDDSGHEAIGLPGLLFRRHRGLCLDRGGSRSPVMGATAFVMAQFLGVGYAEVALAAAIPALLYYFGLFMQVDSYAARHGMKGLAPEEIPELGKVMKEGWYFIFVIVLLVFMLLVMKRESHAPFYATALLIVLNQLFSDKRWGWKDLYNFLEVNGRLFVELVGILAGVGLLIGAFSITGLTSTLTNEILLLADGSVLVLLLLGAITSFILGLGLTDTLLHLPRHPACPGPGKGRAQSDGRAHVHLLLGHAVLDHPAGGHRFLRGGLDRRRPGDEDELGIDVGRQHHLLHPLLLRVQSGLCAGGTGLESLYLTCTTGLGIIAICGGLQGYQVWAGNLGRTGGMEWPLRLALIVGGFILATPGGGLTGLPTGMMEAIGLAILIPAMLASRFLIARSPSAAAA